MDPSRFDDLLRSLSTPHSRRGVLGLLSVLTGLGVEAGQARRRGRGQSVQGEGCRTLNQSCTKKQPQIGKRRKCCSGLVCRDKVCRVKECSGFLGCGQGQACCDGTCLDIQRDPRNCGQCGKDCGGSPCLGGRCLSACVEGQTFCNGACVDVLRDPAHCGACGVTCGGSTPVCRDGRCICQPPAGVCSLTYEDRECCQNPPKAPLADPQDWDSQVRCQDGRCCLGRGSACGDFSECCSDSLGEHLQCLGEYGCGYCVGGGKACPSQCPANGPCELCCDKACEQGLCRTTCQGWYEICNPNDPGESGPCCSGLVCTAGRCEAEASCQNYGQPCGGLLDCCPDLRCNDGICTQRCVPYAGTCRSSADCCNGVPCSGGLCRYN